ncbi:MAG: hypothetical protein IPO17_15405 [Flavobacteriales bacterium]|nr:hypothetical protein [Flavobacteriales bacterium]
MERSQPRAGATAWRFKAHTASNGAMAAQQDFGGFHTPPVKAPDAMGSSATPKVVVSGTREINSERLSWDNAIKPLHAQNSPWQSSSKGMWS